MKTNMRNGWKSPVLTKLGIIVDFYPLFFYPGLQYLFLVVNYSCFVWENWPRVLFGSAVWMRIVKFSFQNRVGQSTQHKTLATIKTRDKHILAKGVAIGADDSWSMWTVCGAAEEAGAGARASLLSTGLDNCREALLSLTISGSFGSSSTT